MTEEVLKRANEIKEELDRIREALEAEGALAIAKLYGPNPAKIVPMPMSVTRAIKVAMMNEIRILEAELKTL